MKHEKMVYYSMAFVLLWTLIIGFWHLEAKRIEKSSVKLMEHVEAGPVPKNKRSIW